MAIPPRFAATVLTLGKSSSRGHTLEIYFDYMCPYCAKIFRTLDTSVVPWLRNTPHAEKIDIVIRPQAQPWDHSSALATEAALAVNAVADGNSETFWKYTRAFVDKREDFLESKIFDEPRNQVYHRLAQVAHEGTGIPAEKVFELLEYPDKDGKRKQLVLDFKRVTKAARKVGNHVTPTIYFNGLEEVGVDSGFTFDQWKEWIEKNIV